MATSDISLELANLVQYRRLRGERVMGLRTLYSEYLVHWVSNLEIQITKVSFNSGASEPGETLKGTEFQLASYGPFLRFKLFKSGSHVYTTSPIVELIGANEFVYQGRTLVV